MQKTEINGIVFTKDALTRNYRRTYEHYEEFETKDIEGESYLINYYFEDGIYALFRLIRIKGTGYSNDID